MSELGPPLPLRGHLDRKGCVALFARLHSAGETGVLELRQGRQVRRFYLLGGSPLWFESGSGPEDVGDVLAAAGLLTLDSAAELRQRLVPSESFRERLVAGGTLTDVQVEEAVRTAIERGIGALLGWPSADWAFDRRNALPVHLLEWLVLGPIDPLPPLWAAARTHVGVEAALGLLETETAGRLIPGPQFAARLGLLPVDEAFVSLAAALVDSPTLDELYRRVPDRSGNLLRLLWLLVAAGLVERDRCPPWTAWVERPEPESEMQSAATLPRIPAAPGAGRPLTDAALRTSGPALGPVPADPSFPGAVPVEDRPSGSATRQSSPAVRAVVGAQAFVPPPVVRLSAPAVASPRRASAPDLATPASVDSAAASGSFGRVTSSPASSPPPPSAGFGRNIGDRTASTPSLRPPPDRRARSTGTHPGVRLPSTTGADVSRVREAHAARASQNYYAYLSLLPEAPRPAIEDACNRLAAIWNEAAGDASVDSEVRDQARELLVDTHLVWRTLGDDLRRAEYDRRLSLGTAPGFLSLRAATRPLTQPGVAPVGKVPATPERRAPVTALVQARAHMDRGEHLAAWPILQRARLEQPSNADVLAEIGWCAFQLRSRNLDDGDTPEEYLQLAVTFVPDHPKALEYLSRVALTRGDHGLARRRLRAFLKVQPEAAWARKALSSLPVEGAEGDTIPSGRRRV